MTYILRSTAVAAGILLASTVAANAVIVDFFGDGDDNTQLGASKVYSSGGASVTANAFEVNLVTQTYTASDLFQRNELPNDQGIGVCNSEDNGGTCSAPGNGETNEIDTNTPGGGTVYDVIRLDISGLTLETLGLSSLDTVRTNDDEANIFFSNVVDLDPTSVAPDITASQGSVGSINPDIDISGFVGFSFIYVTGDVSDNPNGNDNFLVRALGVQVSNGSGGEEIPEPTTLGLLGLGLAGIGLLWRRRKVVA